MNCYSFLDEYYHFIQNMILCKFFANQYFIINCDIN